MKKMRKTREKSPPRSMTVICLLVALSMLAVWGVGMYCLTEVVAGYATKPFTENYSTFARSLTTHLSLYEDYIKELDKTTENYALSRIWETLALASHGKSYGTGNEFYEAGDIPFAKALSGAVAYKDVCNYLYAVFDSEGNMMANSDEDFLYFSCITEEEWNSLDSVHYPDGKYIKVPFDRDKLSEETQESSLSSIAAALRLEGHYKDTEFIPVKIQYIDKNDYYREMDSEVNKVWHVARVYDLPWHTVYEDSGAQTDGAETVTVYADSFRNCVANPSPSFTYMGEKYENLLELAQTLGPQLAESSSAITQSSYTYGKATIIPSVYYSYTAGDKQSHSETNPYYANGQLNYFGLFLVYCTPKLAAVKALKGVYHATFAITLVLTALVCLIIRRHLVKPARAVGQALMSTEPYADIVPYPSRRWRESLTLQNGFENSKNIQQQYIDEIARLNSALDYARTAEENRRRMVSDIAHELKTPLAVIHSYAEGIKEHIAEDKRDKYLDVILSEAQRTDLMVLQMLDLSRLEAGRVKLSREPFSLIKVTKEVFGRLDMLAQEKELSIEYVFPKDFEFNADRARITQAVENLASNAIKYTPQGGKIIVRVLNDKSGVSFTVENESEPMSKDALSKVWDAFYRTDESRSSAGTGLGLAIVKNIVHLHGGACLVRNTAMGVQFGFTI